jgi:O-antigen ligase
MLNSASEKSFVHLLSLGILIVTCFVWAGEVTDPVNAPKLFALGAVSMGVLAVILKFGLKSLWLNSRFLSTLSGFFVLFLFTSTIFSQAPFVQTFYGTYARNTGALTYFFLSVIAIGCSQLLLRESHLKLIRSLLFAGVINVIYCFWVLAFGDPMPWNNTYGNILGLFGNPNFISSFLGIIISVSFAFVVNRGQSKRNQIAYLLLLVCSAFLIFESNSIQGIFVAIAGVMVVVLFIIRARFINWGFTFSYLGVVLIGCLVVIAGMLQHGPLSFIYKKSVSLRGSYWRAGINMGQDHPLTGVGMDAYGDWYRSARPPIALIDTPGPTTLSNASHNVIIDMFASGGWPLLVAYLGVLALGLAAIVNMAIRKTEFDVVAAALSASWVGYQVQSIVSINQIGLAVWGWALTGLLISYAKVSGAKSFQGGNMNENSSKRFAKQKSEVLSPTLLFGVGSVVGLLIAVPPMSSDSQWFKSTKATELEIYKKSLEGSYLNPLTSSRLANASLTLKNSGFESEARKYALEGIKFNRNYFESYLMIYLLASSSPEEKSMAMSNMVRLDPNNPDVLIYK